MPRGPRLDAPGVLQHVMVRGLSRQVISPPTRLVGGGRHPAVTRAREGIASLWVEELGRSGQALALPLGLQPAAIYKAA
jgi:hypothetical protein